MNVNRGRQTGTHTKGDKNVEKQRETNSLLHSVRFHTGNCLSVLYWQFIKMPVRNRAGFHPPKYVTETFFRHAYMLLYFWSRCITWWWKVSGELVLCKFQGNYAVAVSSAHHWTAHIFTVYMIAQRRPMPYTRDRLKPVQALTRSRRNMLSEVKCCL